MFDNLSEKEQAMKAKKVYEDEDLVDSIAKRTMENSTRIAVKLRPRRRVSVTIKITNDYHARIDEGPVLMGEGDGKIT